ncbi:NAD(P)-binding protein [Hypoxylon sp. FL0890]|nr:NAD(P)-binding protein [Hypoxylon sp. FL0890]
MNHSIHAAYLGGIGAAIALNLAKAGHHVFAIARNTSKIPEELSGLPNVTVIQLDVTSKPSVTGAAKVVIESGHGLDGMPILDMDVEKAQQLYDVNVWGCRIVNISTVGATINVPWISAYTSSKAALTNISECLRHELSPFGVTVVTIMVGTIASNFHNNDTRTKLPEESRYAPIEDIIDGWTSGRSTPESMPADQFAAHIVEDIVGNGKGGRVWKGLNAGTIKLATKWFPDSLFDSAMTKDQGIDKLAAAFSR